MLDLREQLCFLVRTFGVRNLQRISCLWGYPNTRDGSLFSAVVPHTKSLWSLSISLVILVGNFMYCITWEVYYLKLLLWIVFRLLGWRIWFSILITSSSCNRWWTGSCHLRIFCGKLGSLSISQMCWRLTPRMFAQYFLAYSVQILEKVISDFWTLTLWPDWLQNMWRMSLMLLEFWWSASSKMQRSFAKKRWDILRPFWDIFTGSSSFLSLLVQCS